MRLVLVEWIDAVYHDLWESLDEIKPVSMQVRSVGWIADTTKDYLTVVPHRQCDQARGGITIPVASILSIQDISPTHNEPIQPAAAV